MRTPAQIIASRLNGAKSRGPVTDSGKRTSSMNALSHGACAETLILEIESSQGFLEMLQALTDEYLPQTPTEAMLIETMAAARWRIRRIYSFEKVTLDQQIRREPRPTAVGPELGNAWRAASAFQKLAEASHTLDLIHRYEARYERQFHRAERRLAQLQASRNMTPEPDLEAASPLSAEAEADPSAATISNLPNKPEKSPAATSHNPPPHTAPGKSHSVIELKPANFPTHSQPTAPIHSLESRFDHKER